MGSNELSLIVDFLSSEFLWLYFIIVFLAFYGIISLFTWSLKKPLMFLGVPTIIAGIIVLLLMLIVNFLPFEEILFEYILLMFKPLFTIGIVFLIVGIMMLVIYKITNKKKNTTESTNL